MDSIGSIGECLYDLPLDIRWIKDASFESCIKSCLLLNRVVLLRVNEKADEERNVACPERPS